ncbi:MAG: MFS transporter, partial [Oscillospiraceae bacterium]|nr:MFS transporter [Oscillospiraceae bacterium]
LSFAYTGFYLISQSASFLSPISIFFVQLCSLVPTMRVLYLIAAFSMSAKAIFLFRFSHETDMGRQRMEETRNVSWLGMLGSYRGVLRQIFRTPATFLLLAILIIVNVITVISNNFVSLYVTQTLGLSETLMGYVSIVRAGLLLLFMLGFQNWVNHLPYRPVLAAGMGIYILAFLSLILSRFSLAGLAVYVVLEAVAFAFISPRKDALLTLFVDKHDRARIFGMIFVITLGLTSPFGSFIGSLSDSNQEYPFLLAIGLCAVCAALVLLVRTGWQEESAG